MLSLLFSCPACRDSPDSESFPLCRLCHSSLLPCPELCTSCGSPACFSTGLGKCLHPWISIDPVIRLRAAYLLLGPGYRVLRRWKIRRGPLFNPRILDTDAVSAALTTLTVERIVPVPQNPRRSLKMGGSPAGTIARHISRRTGIPVSLSLSPTTLPGARRQAELPMSQRVANSIAFSAGLDSVKGRSVLLVDDFMTSGKTLLAAARAVHEQGAIRIEAFFLGVRPRFRSTLRGSDASHLGVSPQKHLAHPVSEQSGCLLA